MAAIVSTAAISSLSAFVRHRTERTVGIRLTQNKRVQIRRGAQQNGALPRHTQKSGRVDALPSERSQHTTERLRLSRERLREISAHSERAREEERRRLARTLHDELGQLFSSIRLELGAAIAAFRESSAPEMRPVVDRLQAAAGLTDIGLASLRQLTTSLRPPILDQLGLLPAIRWEASIFSKRTGIRCHVRARPNSITFDDRQVTALYRILLAALDNVNRHAAAGAVWIHLTRQAGITLMEVRDN